VLLRRVPAHAWERRSCGDGAKGPRLYDWALIGLARRPTGGQAWLLARRSITDPTDIAYYLAHAPTEVTLAELVRVAGARWAVEECFQAAKNEVGLDHHQVRRYDAWYRHITLAGTGASPQLRSTCTLFQAPTTRLCPRWTVSWDARAEPLQKARTPGGHGASAGTLLPQAAN
jgi:hypothetical protein